MTDWSRLQEYVNDYFPEGKYTREEVEAWSAEHVPAWKAMSQTDRNQILDDWEMMIADQTEDELTGILEPIGKKSPTFWDRIKTFLKRFF